MSTTDDVLKNRRKSLPTAALDPPGRIVSYDTNRKGRQPMIANPTRTYTSLDAAYDHFNRELFGGQLPPCLITMQRHKGAYGYFSGERFASLDNPAGSDRRNRPEPRPLRRPDTDADAFDARS